VEKGVGWHAMEAELGRGGLRTLLMDDSGCLTAISRRARGLRIARSVTNGSGEAAPAAPETNSDA
jgi:hypothetical protein